MLHPACQRSSKMPQQGIQRSPFKEGTSAEPHSHRATQSLQPHPGMQNPLGPCPWGPGPTPTS